MGLEFFLFGLLIVSVFTGLVTEAVKKILAEYSIEYKANTLAGLVALIVSAIVGVGYVIVVKTAFTSSIIVYLVALVILSWLCAMVGYDKVIQAISQFKTTNEED